MTDVPPAPRAVPLDPPVPAVAGDEAPSAPGSGGVVGPQAPTPDPLPEPEPGWGPGGPDADAPDPDGLPPPDLSGPGRFADEARTARVGVPGDPDAGETGSDPELRALLVALEEPAPGEPDDAEPLPPPALLEPEPPPDLARTAFLGVPASAAAPRDDPGAPHPEPGAAGPVLSGLGADGGVAPADPARFPPFDLAGFPPLDPAWASRLRVLVETELEMLGAWERAWTEACALDDIGARFLVAVAGLRTAPPGDDVLAYSLWMRVDVLCRDLHAAGYPAAVGRLRRLQWDRVSRRAAYGDRRPREWYALAAAIAVRPVRVLSADFAHRTAALAVTGAVDEAVERIGAVLGPPFSCPVSSASVESHLRRLFAAQRLMLRCCEAVAAAPPPRPAGLADAERALVAPVASECCWFRADVEAAGGLLLLPPEVRSPWPDNPDFAALYCPPDAVASAAAAAVADLRALADDLPSASLRDCAGRLDPLLEAWSSASVSWCSDVPGATVALADDDREAIRQALDDAVRRVAAADYGSSYRALHGDQRRVGRAWASLHGGRDPALEAFDALLGESSARASLRPLVMLEVLAAAVGHSPVPRGYARDLARFVWEPFAAAAAAGSLPASHCEEFVEGHETLLRGLGIAARPEASPEHRACARATLTGARRKLVGWALACQSAEDEEARAGRLLRAGSLCPSTLPDAARCLLRSWLLAGDRADPAAAATWWDGHLLALAGLPSAWVVWSLDAHGFPKDAGSGGHPPALAAALALEPASADAAALVVSMLRTVAGELAGHSRRLGGAAEIRFGVVLACRQRAAELRERFGLDRDPGPGG